MSVVSEASRRNGFIVRECYGPCVLVSWSEYDQMLYEDESVVCLIPFFIFPFALDNLFL
jgi:hypothetical protein